MTAPHKNKHMIGASLIELILTIVIISVALVGILNLVNISIRHSADPMAQQQAIAIAESYMEEILLLPVIDPNGSNSGETRATYDNVDDYHDLTDIGARNQNGDVISGLGNYTVSVSVNDETISSVIMKAVTVSVVRPGTNTINLTGYRANY